MELARAYGDAGADEVTFLDVSASSSGRETMVDVVRRTAEGVFVPLTVGGGVRAVEDVDRLLRAGADKIGVNTAAIARPELVSEIADRFGNQVLVLSVDARRCAEGVSTPSGYEVTTHGGRRGTGIDAVAWAARGAELGAGEILLNSMDADGTTDGFDLEMTRDGTRGRRRSRSSRRAGLGRPAHFVEAALAGADAVLAASVFHFGTLSIARGQDRDARGGDRGPVSGRRTRAAPATRSPAPSRAARWGVIAHALRTEPRRFAVGDLRGRAVRHPRRVLRVDARGNR